MNGSQAARRSGARPTVALYDDPLFREHDAGPGHPERPERLDALRRGLVEAGLESALVSRPVRPATPEELLRVHTPRHVEQIAKSEGRHQRFDPDTAASPQSYAAALRAAGAVADAVDRVLDGDVDRALCAVRPPGHHATADRAMGFCLFNNVAVGAAHALARGLERVAVVDFDVHHGNGTQDIFAADPRVLYVSSHQYPFYPGTGAVDEVGEGDGRGFTVNLPMPAGLGDGDYARAYREVVEPIARAFDPQLVLVSAGFDAHARDPLAGMAVTRAGFAMLADVCVGLAAGAAQGRVVAVLEGGYDLDGIAEGAAVLAARLLDTGLGAESAPARPPHRHLGQLLEAWRAAQAPRWPFVR
jgi:acetoin utilization deacetylase AcuC-like enzyme